MQHNSFGIGFDPRLLGPGRLAAIFGVMAHFLAVITDCAICWVPLASGSSHEEFEKFVLEAVILGLLSGAACSGIPILASVLTSVGPFANGGRLEPLLFFCRHRGRFDVDNFGSGLQSTG